MFPTNFKKIKKKNNNKGWEWEGRKEKIKTKLELCFYFLDSWLFPHRLALIHI